MIDFNNVPYLIFGMMSALNSPSQEPNLSDLSSIEDNVLLASDTLGVGAPMLHDLPATLLSELAQRQAPYSDF